MKSPLLSIGENGRASGATGPLLWACLLSALASALVFPFDHEVAPWLAGLGSKWPARPTLLRVVKSLGKTDLLAIVLLLVCLTRQRRAGVAGLVSLALVALPVLLLKDWIQRPRPEHSGFSFPSGDAANASAALLPLALSLRSRGPWVGAAILAVCAGRVAEAYHYPSDVLAGAALGAPAAWAGIRWTPRIGRRPRARVIVPLLVLGLAVSTVLAWQSHGKPPFPAFAVTILPVGLAVVVRERAWLARRRARVAQA